VFIQRKANQIVDAIIANSRAVAQFAAAQESADPALYRVIPNGIDPREFIGAPDLRILRLRYKIPFHRRVIGIVANFSPVKDHRLFVAIAYELLRRRADLHFLMMGDGPLVTAIDKLIDAGGAKDCFTRVSTTSELPDLYALMDVSVLCSHVEGFPNAVLESMAVGKPVVAPAVGGICELIRDGETGRLIASRNPADFADAIIALLDNPDTAARMGKLAAAEIEAKYSLAAMVDAYRALYNDLLARKRAGV
jgi:glycosyltransferase involved in cell wall biosynthesis